MSLLKIAFLQISPGKTLSENLEKGLDACKTAKENGADIILFPEMWSCGYDFYTENKSELLSKAINKNSSFVQAFRDFAKSNNVAVCVTYLEKYGVDARNSLSIFDRFGNHAFTYAKVHTCDFGDEKVLTSGDDFYVSCLNTEKGNVYVGAMICYDREFPESARILMLKGAEIVLVPNACPMEINRLSQLRGRAYENMIGIATCNYPIGVPDCNGHSSAFDGVAYLPKLSGSRDTCVFEADERCGIFYCEFDLDMIRKYRSTEVHGNAYRRPEKYKLIVNTNINEPFIREDRK